MTGSVQEALLITMNRLWDIRKAFYIAGRELAESSYPSDQATEITRDWGESLKWIPTHEDVRATRNVAEEERPDGD